MPGYHNKLPPISRKARQLLNPGGLALTEEQRAAISGTGDLLVGKDAPSLTKDYDYHIDVARKSLEDTQKLVDATDVDSQYYEKRSKNLADKKAALEALLGDKAAVEAHNVEQGKIDDAIKTEQNIIKLEEIVAADPTNTEAAARLAELKPQSKATVGTEAVEAAVEEATPIVSEETSALVDQGLANRDAAIAKSQNQAAAAQAAAAKNPPSPEEEKGIMDWMESLGLGEYFDKGQLANMAMQYFGSRLLGYDHGASASWAIKQYGASVQAAQASQSAKAEKNEERAFELYKEGVIDLDQYNQMVASGKIPAPTPPSGTAGAASVQSKVLEAHGIDPTKKLDKYVKSTEQNPGGEIVEAWYGSGTFWIPDGKGGLKAFDTTGYEKWTSEQHAEVNVQKNLKTALNSFADEHGYRTEIREQKDGKTVTRTDYTVSPSAAANGYINHLKQKHGANAYIYANTPAGRAEAQAYYEAAANFTRKMKGKDKKFAGIKNWGGFFNAVNAGVYGADGHIKIELLGRDSSGALLDMKHYTTLNTNLGAFRNKHPDIKTDGEAMKLAIDTFTDPKTDAEKEAVAKAKKNVPAGSSAMMEFVKIYFKEG